MDFKGWTSFWNTIYYIDKKAMEDKALKEHELVHIDQMKRDGKIKFFFKYMYYWIKFGYEKNPYEVEAKEREDFIRKNS